MPNYYALNLECSCEDTSGNFKPYGNNNNLPSGRVWWTAPATPPWTPLPTNAPNSPPNSQGNPDYAIPTVSNGDQFWVAVRDPAPPAGYSVSHIAISIVFSKFTGSRSGRPPQAGSASPFQPNNEVQTDFRHAFSREEGWWSSAQHTVIYPSGSNQVSFEFAVGVTVTYTGPKGARLQRQYGIDPEMDVDDYGGS